MRETRIKKTLRKLLVFWAPAIIWMLVIFAFSSLTTQPVSQVYWREFLLKKSAHFIEYFILFILTYRAFLNSGVKKERTTYFSLIFCILYAISDEFHQSFTPGREPKIRDVLIDGGGSISAMAAVIYYLPKSGQKFKGFAKKLMLI